MKKVIFILVLLLFISACGKSATQNSTDTEESEPPPATWKKVDGYAVDKAEEGGQEKILLVEGITPTDALEKTAQEILADGYDNAIWLTDKDIDFPDLQKGDPVTAWWDPAKPHQEPGILTVPAEKVEMN